MLNSINRYQWRAWAVAAGLCLASAGHAADRVIQALNMTVARGQTNTITVVLSSLGDENGLGFSLQFDTNHLAYVSAKRGTHGTNSSATLNVNANATHLALGRVGFGLALPANTGFIAGSNEMVVVSFRALADGPTVTTPVRFFDLPIPREIVDAEVNSLDATYLDASVTVQGTCSYALGSPSAGFVSGGGSGQVALTAGNGCAWSINNTNPWITLTSPNAGSGSALVTYAVQANTGASTRSGVVVIAGLPFTVTQSGAVCTYTLSPTSRTNGHGATTSLVSVVAGPGCAWNVVNSQTWISFSGPTNGTGDGTVSYVLSANTNSSDRTAVLVIGGASFALTQRGVPCEISLSPTNRTHGYSAATGTVSVTSVSGCVWRVVNSNSWISIQSGLTNSGSGSIAYAVESNLSSVPRTGVVMIADQVLTLIQQAGSCTYRVSPISRQHGYGLATNTFTIYTSTDCPWDIVNPNSWITILNPVHGQGGTLVTYAVAANPFIVGRTGVVMVAGETFTISQLPASCNHTLTPKYAEYASGAASGLITVTAPAGCTWTVTGAATWVTNAPATLPTGGMALWLRADAGTTGSPISQWLDQSGNNRHASQASSISQPTLRTSALNGLPAVRFDGVNDFFTFNLPVNGLSGMSVFLVTANIQNQNGGSVEAERAALFWNETAAWGTVYVSPFQSAINLRFGTTQANNRTIYSRPASVGSAFTLTEAIKNGATDSLYVNGTLVNSQGGKLTTIAGCRDIGNVARGYNDNTYFAGDIAEVVIYNRALSAAERATVEQVLGSKYGLPTPNSAPLVPVPTGPNSWVTLTSGASGTGNGTVGYAVAANTNAASRTATLTIGDETFDITQAAFGTSCIFHLSTTNRIHGNAAATNTVTLTTGAACNWSVFKTNAWITFAPPTNRTGGATLTYSVAANALPTPRTGLVRIADQVLVLTQLEAACYRLSPTNRSHGYGAATNNFTVQAGLTCPWDVVNTNSWIAILSAPSGSGTSVVSYAVSPNSTALSRTGVIMVEDKTFVITQGAAPCTPTLTPSSGNHGGGAETALITVTSPPGCLWTVVNTNPWIRLTTSDLGTGSGSFGYAVESNLAATARSGVIVVGGANFNVTQAGDSRICSYKLSTTNRVHGPAAATNTITLTTSNQCVWTLANSNPWITFQPPSSGTGGITHQYSVSANPNSTWRTGLVFIADQILTIAQQPGSCTIRLSPTNRPHGYGSATNSISVQTGTGCSWTVTNTVDWIVLLSPTNGTGPDDIGYAVKANANTSSRTGLVYVADQVFSLIQAGAPCELSISPSSTSRGYAASTGLVAVTAPPGCAWTVTNTNQWLDVTPMNGSGDASVTYRLTANANPNSRTGTVLFNGESFVVTQAGTVLDCTARVSPTNRVHGAGATTNSVTITVEEGCTWAVSDPSDWLTMTSSGGSGTMTLNYTLAANPTFVERTSVVQIAGQLLTVVQHAASCGSSLTPSSRTHGFAGGTNTVDLTTLASCPSWSVINTNPWISFAAPLSGVGGATLFYSVASNAAITWRTGIVVVAGETLSVIQRPVPCEFELSPMTRTHGPGAATNTVSVTTLAICPWTATTTNSWIHPIAGVSGAGAGTVTYAVDANPALIERIGALLVGDQSLILTQRAAVCSFTVAPTNRQHIASGESSSINVTALSGCTWEVINTNSWVTIISGASGSGNGTVRYAVTTNNGDPRRGFLVIGGVPFDVFQAGAGRMLRALDVSFTRGQTGSVVVILDSLGDENALGFSLCFNPADLVFVSARRGVSATNAAATMNVNSNQAPQGRLGLALALPSNEVLPAGAHPLVEVTFRGTAGSGTTNTTVALCDTPIPREPIDVDANELSATYGNATVTLNGTGPACNYALSPTDRAHTFLMETGTVAVTALTGCLWTASSTNAWITFLAPTNGAGNGVVTYVVASNPGTAPRAGTLFIEGGLVTLTQASNPCPATLSASNRLYGPAATNGSVGIVIPAGCTWTVSNPHSWITISSPNNGTGPATVNYSVAANTSSLTRTGVVMVAGVPLTIVQAAAQCTFGITPTHRAHVSATSANSVTVTSVTGCPWMVVNTNEWFFVVSGGSGLGNGEVSYVLDANPNTLYRTGVVAIAGRTFTVTQDPAPCTFALAWTNGQHTASAASGTVQVTAPTGCSWTTVNTNPWIALIAGTNGSGRGTITYTVSANPSPIQRTGALSVGGESIFISQAGIGCTFTLTPGSRIHGMGTESGLISVATLSTCPWAVVNTNSWIQIKAGLTGVGNNTVKYSVLDNPNPSTRTATFTVGDQVFTVIQFGTPCSFTLLPTNRVHGSGGGTTTVSVLTVDECTWGVVNTNAWIGIIGATNGAGSATVTYSMQPNPQPNDRSGTMTIAGQRFSFVQLASACAFSVGPTNHFFHGSGAETGLVQVTSYAGCIWTPSRTNTWVTLGSSGGTGDGAVGYSLAPNPTALTRSTVLTIAGAAVRITQGPAPCSFALAPTSLAHGPLLGTGVVSVLTLTGCTWTVTQTNPWITLLSNTNGSNGVNVSYRVLANPTAVGRTGLVYIADLPLTVSQAGANCTYSLSPTNRTIAFGGGTGLVSVATIPGCVWSVVNTSSWVTLTSPTSFVGSNNVTYSAEPNPMGMSRTSVVVIAGLTHTITQSGAPCVFTITPTTRMHGPLAETNFVTLNALVGCPWTVVNTNGWINFPAGTNGNGPGPIAYTLAPNNAVVSRVGTVVIAGLPVTITNLGAFLTCPPNRTYDCGTPWVFEAPSAVGACGGTNINLRIVSTITNPVCGNAFNAVRTWEATDNCGNRVTCSQSINVVVTNAPVLACAANRTVEAGSPWSFDFPTAIGACGQTVTLNIVSTTTNRAGACGDAFSATRNWEAVDACGNRSVCAQTITVVDTTPPVLTCAPNKTISCGSAWTFDSPAALDAGDGTNVIVTILNTTTNGVCGAAFSAQRIWQVEDRCGNRVTCSQTVFNRQVTVGGTVYYGTNYPSAGPNAKRLGNAALALSGSSETTNRAAADGSYGFSLYGGGNFTITPWPPTNEPPAQGVSTLDISLIRRHVLNMATLDSPYKLLAADVNLSRSVTTLDISYIRRLVLDATNTLPGGLWRFVPSDYVFLLPASPWDAPTNRVYPSLTSNLTSQDFVAVKLGDVNNSWTLAASAGGEAGFQAASASDQGALAASSLPPVTFSASAHTNGPGETITVHVRVSGFRDVTSAQFTLEWDPTVLRFNAVGGFALAGIANGNFGLSATDQGRLAFSWDDPAAAGATVANETAIFGLTFTVIGQSGTESLVRFSDQLPEREVAVQFNPANFVPVDGWVIVGDSTAPSLALPAYGPSGFAVRLLTAPGRSYILEYTDSLPATEWKPLPAVSGDGTMKTLSDPSPSSAQRFYRVRTE